MLRPPVIAHVFDCFFFVLLRFRANVLLHANVALNVLLLPKVQPKVLQSKLLQSKLPLTIVLLLSTPLHPQSASQCSSVSSYAIHCALIVLLRTCHTRYTPETESSMACADAAVCAATLVLPLPLHMLVCSVQL